MDERVGAVRVTGELGAPSRWLWLVKWVLLLPHLLVLSALWLAFAVVGVLAFFAILATGRYPRPLFDFSVGVLRWSWRVHYYGYAALGTDRYPPFTLADVPDYPARLAVDYPPRLSRGLVLVKWWLLALPHYVVVGLLAGGGLWVAGTSGDGFHWGAGGLIGVLTLVAGVVLLVRGTYPRPLHDLLVGLDRWVLRVAAYAALLTDEYPPFRLDTGPTEPDGGAPGPSTATPAPPAAAESTSDLPAIGGPAPHREGWTVGRVLALITGSVVAMAAVGVLTGGIAVLVADRTQRDADGYLSTPQRVLASGGHAVTAPRVDLDADPGWSWAAAAVGEVSVRVRAGDRAVFVGVAPADDVDRYLGGVAHAVLRADGENGPTTEEVAGWQSPARPAAAGFWTASATGTGTVALDWAPAPGEWTVVVMNADASAGVRVRASVGATAPALPWIAVALFATGAAALACGAALVVGAARRAGAAGPPS
ncbi:DUF4389 domain-containing protein [Actinokineospora globicatena]|uniref:DUF4389 domain-containing protein n=1 Tax=Actinokineospora globicatena TaxID=103729 RepID=UPI0020A59684|nr:DUF4389 domain-containing protein [Actinokineospora globicatena]MCP2306145.1 protein of unknown function (DUF4389) [Actinokineospora globicatena]GLW79980.1 hypothetical protein Aglo01_44610 [Actinokineospora globicatena]GLW86809.1 hypothetical protein Aglo02_44480 [Actinokineospora globicatena]